MNVNMAKTNMTNILNRTKGLLLIAVLCTLLFAGCDKKGTDTTATPEPTAAAEYIDFASKVKLDMNSRTKKQEVTVKTYVDGDTTHFNVPESVMAGGILKARYIAINTPESTGKIEEWGKKASKFTKEKLSSATSIIVESDSEQWDIDSTGSRCLVWVWYRTSETEEYRNLNIELLQNGLAIASSSANNIYGTTCMDAINNARALKLNIYSGEKDPDFFYGDAIELTAKELRTHIADYAGQKVAFEGVVTKNGSNGVYVESLDEDTGLYYGIYVYYGFGLNGEGLSILSVGNKVRIVGSVQLYETAGTYQISGLTYRQMKPNDPGNIQKLGEGYSASFVETDADTLMNGKVTLTLEEGEKTFDYGFLTLDTTVTVKDLTVTDIYTTNNAESSSNGAMTLTCKTADGVTVTVRTDVLYDEAGKLITADAYEGRNITVRGLVASYDGKYQIKVLSSQDIIINN